MYYATKMSNIRRKPVAGLECDLILDPLQLPDYNYLIWWIPSCLAPPKQITQNDPKWVLDQHHSIAYFVITLWWMNIHRSQLFWYKNQAWVRHLLSQETQGWRWCTRTEAASFAWWFHRPWSACLALCCRCLAFIIGCGSKATGIRYPKS